MLAIFHELMKKLWLCFFPVVLTVLLVPTPPSAKSSTAAPKATASSTLSLLKMQTRTERKARRACEKREIFIDFGIPLRKCEGWQGEPCQFQIPYRDRGWCEAGFFMDDAQYGAMGWEAQTTLYEVKYPNSVWYIARGDTMYQWGSVKWKRFYTEKPA